MREVIVAAGQEIDLGRHGEHLATCVTFDISEWINTYGDGAAQLIHQRNGDEIPYPCEIERDKNTVTWIVTQYDVGVAGRGRAELQYYVDGALVKSEIYATATERALYRNGESVPPPYQGWMDKILKAGSDAVAGAEAAEVSAASAEQSANAAGEYADQAQRAALTIQGKVRPWSLPRLSETQEDQIFRLAYKWYRATGSMDSSDHHFQYYGNINRNKYAYKTIYKSDTGRVMLNCNCWAMLVWAGIDPETFPENKGDYTADIVKAFDWGHWFRFPFREFRMYRNEKTGKPHGFVQPNPDNYEGSYSYYSYYNPESTDPYKQSYLSMMNGDHMALELRLAGLEVPISDIAVGDMVFFGARDLNDGSDDEREEHDFLNITHCGIVYKIDEATGFPQILDCTNSVGTNYPIVMTKSWGVSERLQARAYDLYKRIVMVARHPAAIGKQNPVPDKFYDMDEPAVDDDSDEEAPRPDEPSVDE